MKQAIMTRWVKALRSGKYKQTREQLREADKEDQPTNAFCCLGVLCDLFAKEHPSAKWLDRKTAEDVLNLKTSGCAFSVADKAAPDGVSVSAGILPDPVMRWAGIKESNGDFTLTDNVRKRDLDDNQAARFADSLTNLNDDAGFNFAEIAAFVEKHWRKL